MLSLGVRGYEHVVEFGLWLCALVVNLEKFYYLLGKNLEIELLLMMVCERG